MQSGSWYLGTPGMTVTSLAPLRLRGGRLVRVPRRRVPRPRAPRRGDGLAGIGSSAGSAARLRRRPPVVIVLAGDRRRASAVVGRHRVGRVALSRRLRRRRRHRLASAASAASSATSATSALRFRRSAVSAASAGLVRLVVLEPRVASRPVIVVGVDVGGVSGRRRAVDVSAACSALLDGSAFALGSAVSDPASAWSVPGRRDAGRVGDGLVQPVEPARGHGARSGPRRRRGRLVGAPPRARGKRRRLPTAAPWAVTPGRLLPGRPGRADLVAGRPRRLRRARLPVRGSVALAAGAWPKAVRRCANGGFTADGASRPAARSPAVSSPTGPRRSAPHRAAPLRPLRPTAAAAASNAAVAGPGTFSADLSADPPERARHCHEHHRRRPTGRPAFRSPHPHQRARAPVHPRIARRA